ncbi:MAG: hypothetical protein M1822_001146 [Bathelium mastoideum]|nr:MAG: hypothetical protein M1822_001146 [Bathelium mastoideum]
MPIAHLPSPPSVFPTYLIPSLPFRRRKSSNDSTDSTASSAASSVPNEDEAASDTRAPAAYLNGHSSHLRCARCLADLCQSSQIISKGFTGRHGRAYLVSPPSAQASLAPFKGAASTTAVLPNTNTHKAVPRTLVTGAHTVSDISCAQCGSVLGWKYVAAEEESQRYKVGKFILETRKVCRSSCWENDGMSAASSPWDDAAATEELGAVGGSGVVGDDGEAVEFDSQDEDECEDLFAGIWSPALAKRRRKSRKFSAIGHN